MQGHGKSLLLAYLFHHTRKPLGAATVHSKALGCTVCWLSSHLRPCHYFPLGHVAPPLGPAQWFLVSPGHHLPCSTYNTIISTSS